MNTAQTAEYITQLELKNRELTKTINNNTVRITEYETLLKKKDDNIANLEKQNARLFEKLKLALYRQFCRHAEKFKGIGQPLLFESDEKAAPKVVEKVPVAAHERTKSKRGRKRIADNVPRLDPIVVDISEEEKQCACGHEMVQIKAETFERLVIIPEQVFVQPYIVKSYACHYCEGSGDEEKPAVRHGKIPSNIMPGSIASSELLAFIFTKKYCDYVPYYRQEASFSRIGVTLSRQDMSAWQIKTMKRMEPLFELLRKGMTAGEVINMDETPMHVLKEPGRENKQQSYMWLARGGPPDKKVVWYEYKTTRAHDNAAELLEGFKGWLQTDGLKAYETALRDMKGIIHVGCFAHVRRRFYEASQISSKEGDAEAALAQIQQLYLTEKKLRKELLDKELDTTTFLSDRRTKCEPVLNAFHEWLLALRGKILPSSKLGDAINYTLDIWPSLTHYLDHWELTPDNNAAERAIRPFVMGRKNWVMSGSPRGAESSCRLYTLIETAKEAGLNPYAYLRSVFTKAADMTPSDDWSRLLPWNLKA
jgi:transposase